MMKYRYCPNCGAKVPVNIKFCPRCGHTLNFNQASKSKMNQSFNNLQHHHYGKWIIGILVILVIIISGYGYRKYHEDYVNKSHVGQQYNQNNHSNNHANNTPTVSPKYYGMSHAAYGYEIGGIWSLSVENYANNMPHSKKGVIKDAKYYKGGSHNKDYQAILNWAKQESKKNNADNNFSNVSINPKIISFKHKPHHITVVTYRNKYMFNTKHGNEVDKNSMWTATFENTIDNSYILSNRPNK